MRRKDERYRLGRSVPAGHLAPGAAVLAVLVSQAFKTWQARITSQDAVAQEQAYRQVAEEAAAAQQRLAAAQEQVVAQLTELNSRLTAVEKLLREVE